MVSSGGFCSPSAANLHLSEGHAAHRPHHLFSIPPQLCHPAATIDGGDGASSFPTTKAGRSILQPCEGSFGAVSCSIEYPVAPVQKGGLSIASPTPTLPLHHLRSLLLPPFPLHPPPTAWYFAGEPELLEEHPSQMTLSHHKRSQM